MTTTTTHTEQFLKRRRFLLVLPLLVIPFLCFAFYMLGGGASGGITSRELRVEMGFNTQLPRVLIDKKENSMNKLSFYNKADEDSARLRQLLSQDPYQRQTTNAWLSRTGDSPVRMTRTPLMKTLAPTEDVKADELLAKLQLLKQSLLKQAAPSSNPHQSSSVNPSSCPTGQSIDYSAPAISKLQNLLRATHPSTLDTTVQDPELERLNNMLDKIIRIQHPNTSLPTEDASTPLQAALPQQSALLPLTAQQATHQLSDSSHPANAIPAVVQESQTLVAGATIALRLTSAAEINNISIPKDQLIYGVVSINNDRMQVMINSIQHEQSIYLTSLQVYDMDGLPGIHIPGLIVRDVAKESADQGINGLNIAGYDPTLGAQATVAGIQAAKTLLSRKIKLVRVSIPAGYHVLLRSTKANGGAATAHPIAVSTDHLPMHGPLQSAPHDISPMPDTVVQADLAGPIPTSSPQSLNPDSLHAFLHQHIHKGELELTLQGIYLRNGLMYFSFLLDNGSAIPYSPEYILSFIQDRKKMKRTAVQEISMHPVYQDIPGTVAGKTKNMLLLAFHPFTLDKDKQFVFQFNEQDGGRQLRLLISPQTLLKVK